MTSLLAWIPNFPPEAVRSFQRLLDEPVGDLGELKGACLAHVEAFEAAARGNEFVSLAEARGLSALCVRLIDGLDASAPELSRRLVWATARYFIHSHDADYDFGIAGLDDDIAVANAVACYLGRSDWCLAP